MQHARRYLAAEQQGAYDTKGKGGSDDGADGKGQQQTGGDAKDDDDGKAGDDDDGLSGLLDGEAGRDDDDDDGGDDGGKDGDDGQSGDGKVDVDDLVAKAVEKLEGKFDQIADRRVNAILREIRGKGKKGDGKQDDDDDGGKQQSDDGSKHDVLFERAARLAFREYVSDGIRFLDSEERALAMELGHAKIRESNGDGDEEQVARTVADDVVSTIQSLRKLYEKRTVAALKRRGALKDQEQQPPRGPHSVGDSSEFTRGEERAKALYGSPEDQKQ